MSLWYLCAVKGEHFGYLLTRLTSHELTTRLRTSCRHPLTCLMMHKKNDSHHCMAVLAYCAVLDVYT